MSALELVLLCDSGTIVDLVVGIGSSFRSTSRIFDTGTALAVFSLLPFVQIFVFTVLVPATLSCVIVLLLLIGGVRDVGVLFCRSCCFCRWKSSNCCNNRSFSFKFTIVSSALILPVPVVLPAAVSTMIDSIFRFKCFGLCTSFFFVAGGTDLLT